MPYVLPLFPYTEVTPRLWFIVGLGDGKWTNSKEGLGTSLIPLGVVNGKKYNLSGDGEFVYTGYFKSSRGFKLIRDYKTSNWNDSWGMTGSSYVHNGGGNIQVPSDGYYTITLNSIENSLTIKPSDAPSNSYNSIDSVSKMIVYDDDGDLYETWTYEYDNMKKLVKSTVVENWLSGNFGYINDYTYSGNNVTKTSYNLEDGPLS